MGTIFIDLLVIINLYITFFLLKGTQVFLQRQVSVRRTFLGALIGGASSLVILLPPIPFVFSCTIKLTVGLVIVLAVFGFKGGYFKNAFVFVVINIIFAGLTLMLWFFAAPLGMEYNNGYAYFDISFTMLLYTTAASYGLIRGLRYLIDVKDVGEREYQVRITSNGTSVTLSAVADTGNMLIDYFTGARVIVCPYESVKAVVPHGIFDAEPPIGVRLLPYNTISSSGLIPTFKPDEVTVIASGLQDKPVTALIGVTERCDTEAVFNPKLLI